MTGFSGNPNADMRQCMYCGEHIRRDLSQCPHCREAQSEVRLAAPSRTAKGGQFRNGLLLMLMSAVIHYFAGGYSALALPVQINPAVTAYLAPLLFLSGLSLTLYGLFLRVRA
jgi:hypothetical protein